MGSQRYSPEFKVEAVRQIRDRGYSVIEASDRLGVSSAQPVQMGQGSEAGQEKSESE